MPGEEVSARGRVVFAKPGRMRWVYVSPEPSLVVSDGETLWIYDPTLKEVQVLSVDAGFLSGTAIQFLLGEGKILESFIVSAESCEGDELSLDLRPKQNASYERLKLRVEKASGAILATAVLDLFGNRTEVVFERMQRNRAPDESLFRFEPSEDDRVLTLPQQE
jgi:outer membrane lipoprotein-sorting protein